MAMAVRIGSVGRIEGFSLQPKNLVGEGVVRKDACGVAFRHHQHQHRRGAARAALMQTAPLPMSSVATKRRLPAFLSIFFLNNGFSTLAIGLQLLAQGFCW